jgi:ABC-type bacteriocin/lantibiotic exporter with double-glycine peptidase domain
MISTLLNYLANSSAITYIVLALLSVYTIVVFWIFFYRNNALNRLIANEKRSLEILTKSQPKL